VNKPTPALVTQREAQPLPRWALLIFCAAYLLPGLFGRDPWKAADISAFGYMLSIAQGQSSWWAPTVGGLPPDAALLPYWLGAAFIKLLGPTLGTPLAARIPFAALLGLVLALTWYSTYHLARTEAAQPLELAFGGQASVVDYSRALADGAVLGLIATLGLLQLGHETTPELVQLLGAALFLYALAASPFRGKKAKLAALTALPMLAASGAPSIAVALGLAGMLVCLRSAYPAVKDFAVWVTIATALSAGLATALGAWALRLGSYDTPDRLASLVRLLLWFAWPAWLLSLWTLWRWRLHILRRHIAVPLASVIVMLIACIAMGGSDRALLLALPPCAVLAAFALPTLQRGAASAIDWFSVFFFSVCALAIWVVYAAMQTGVPAKPAANVARLAPGFENSFSALALSVAALATLAWLWLVRWRTGRSRHQIWKSMVLPAGGVALCWLLLMTLWLPLLDYARSYRTLVARIAQHVPRHACITAPSLSLAQLAALEYFGGYQVRASGAPDTTRCEFTAFSVSSAQAREAVPGWEWIATENRPTDRNDATAIYRRRQR